MAIKQQIAHSADQDSSMRRCCPIKIEFIELKDECLAL
ncbi:hypothetical protein WJ66_01215 [Stenotrophomonas maltophilia WJ66]|nr:hypothetical protein WJ66_01215 [Stenotrophomonas maltophilia WJ66]